ncbi:MAG: hypothetical protein WKF28_06740 [Rubrobacteraceae bacterium]
MFTIRQYMNEDWEAICRVHDRAPSDELRGSCDPRAFVPLAKDTGYEEDFLRATIPDHPAGHSLYFLKKN